jgi:hypothetical protein
MCAEHRLRPHVRQRAQLVEDKGFEGVVGHENKIIRLRQD